ncbi:MAG: hypothetical protein V4449_03865 [Patescibacteria group bacterium]
MINPFGLNDFKENEQVVAIVRHHWFVLLREVFGLVILFLAPFFVIPIAFAIAVQGGTVPPVPGGVVIFFASLWTLVLWNLLFVRWTDYYYDIWVITNHRIVDIDQKGLFNRSTATLLTLDHIQDIEAQLNGIIGNLLNFGNVTIQTAAAHREFIFEEVASPNGVVHTIRDAQNQGKHSAGSAHSV